MIRVRFDNRYYRQKNLISGAKGYIPFVFFRGLKRTLKKGLKHPFKKAQEAVRYGSLVAYRYNRMFCSEDSGT